MEELIDLQELANKLIEDYQNLYTGEEIELPNEFKNKVNQIDNNSITYQQYSAVVSTKGVQKGVLNIYLPNQWFYIASFFTRYYNELQKYKTISSEFFSTDRLKQLKGNSLTTVEENKLSKKYGDKTKEYIKEFVTNYDWWGGGKTIDRTDFFVSPILNYARLVNASQSYVADLCAFLAKNEELVGLLYNAINHHKSHSVSTAKIVDTLSFPLQQIFYGAPGTGKSHEIKKQTIGEQVIRTTFHPDSDYSTFVGAYKPTTKQVPMRDVTGKVIHENKEDVTEDRIIYEFVEQAFLQAYTQAWRLYAQTDDEQPQKQFLVIEEINRGNCAQIFGDLFQLLDRNDAGFSEYPIKADRDMRKQLAKAFAGITITDKSTINQWFDGKDVAGEVLSGEVLLLPSNLFIWATMNTSDQSLFPIDSAFKRRWDWQYIPISNANKGWKIKVNGKQYDWWNFLEKMNEQINATTNSEDKKMGYFFCKAKNGIIDAKTFVGKVVFYVWNDVFKDFANEAGGIFKDEDGSLLSFNKFYHVVNGKTEVLEDKVELLLNNLGVPAEGETIDVEELEKNASANSSKNYLKEIVFPDGTIYSTSEMTHFDAYMAAIRKIGIEKVASVADKLKYRRLNRPLISAEKYEEIENSAGFSYYQEGSYFFVKGVMTYTLVRILEDLNEMLNVGMTINN